MLGSIDLGQDLEAYVDQLVRSGRYGSRSEILREGVRLIEQREQRLERLDAALSQGLQDAQADRVTPIADVNARLIAKYRSGAEAAGR